jgi:PP-loop superfamily ATP-utilizing enzyme
LNAVIFLTVNDLFNMQLWKHQIIEISKLNIPGYAENDQNRCYFYKNGLFEKNVTIMQQIGFKNLVYGLIADDMSDHRPGVRAANEHGSTRAAERGQSF